MLAIHMYSNLQRHCALRVRCPWHAGSSTLIMASSSCFSRLRPITELLISAYIRPRSWARTLWKRIIVLVELPETVNWGSKAITGPGQVDVDGHTWLLRSPNVWKPIPGFQARSGSARRHRWNIKWTSFYQHVHREEQYLSYKCLSFRRWFFRDSLKSH